jgi:hypothetical protein
MVIGFIDHSQVVTTTKYNILTDHSTLKLLSVLSLVVIIRFLATDLSESHCNFKHHCNYSTCKVFKSPVTVAEQSKTCTVFAPSEAGIVGSNPTQGMDVWFVYMFILSLCCPVFR